jgi:hypothetical protein
MILVYLLKGNVEEKFAKGCARRCAHDTLPAPVILASLLYRFVLVILSTVLGEDYVLLFSGPQHLKTSPTPSSSPPVAVHSCSFFHPSSSPSAPLPPFVATTWFPLRVGPDIFFSTAVSAGCSMGILLVAKRYV